jgi:Calcineurin-like phosphoesterase
MPDPQPPLQDISDEVKILHLSDLHAGRGFEINRWNELLALVGTEILPNVVIVSGDMVNSPTRREFKQAAGRIEELHQRCKPDTEFIVLPGNHDTRISGIFSVSRVRMVTAAVLVVLAALSWLLASSELAIPATQFSVRVLPIMLVLVALAAIVLSVALFYYVSFERHFPPSKAVVKLDKLGLEVLNFDSSSDVRAHWAEGIVRESDFVAVRSLIGETPSRNFRMAVLHHHALPIPYEAGAEPMMVLRNAGAFLREISLLKVALVLHGHRHRFSFSRVSMNADDQPFQIGVLSTGSVTSGDRDAARLGHSFSVIDLNRWGNARITRYQSKDRSTFAPNEPFMARSIPVATSEFYFQNALVNGCCCDSIRVNIQITPDGDAHNTIETRGFKVKRPLDALPGSPKSLAGTVVTGQIERVHLGKHNFPPGFSPSLRGQRERRSFSGTLEFGSTLKPADEPVDFAWERDLVNSFAMSVRQYQAMYNKNDVTPVESTRFRLRHVPAAELMITVEFPPGFAIDGLPMLGVFKGTNPEPELAREYRKGLSYDRKHNVILARIPHPPLDFDYLVEWKLSAAAAPISTLVPSSQGRIYEVVKKMLGLDLKRNPLKHLCEKVRDASVGQFHLQEDSADLHCSIMAYDTDQNVLRLVGASDDGDDQRWDFKLNYGDGIAGRAYKMNKGRVFTKRKAIAAMTPFYYVADGDQPISDDGHEITYEVLISLPLFTSESSEVLIGILNLSSKSAASKLADLNEGTLDQEVRDFIESVGDSCLEVLDDLNS